MRYIRPFDLDALAPAEAGAWLINPDEGVGCWARLRRGGAAVVESATHTEEHYALVLRGSARLIAPDGRGDAKRGELIFVPAGASAAVNGDEDSVWLEVFAPLRAPAARSNGEARVIAIDQNKFEGEGFAYQSLIDRTGGAQTMRMNTLKVSPGAGSPNFHIHAFAQIYVIFDGELTIDIGRARQKAYANTLVLLPPGLVHRNFNGGATEERHTTLLVPEPADGAIFDYAITIHEHEAELMTQAPAAFA